MGDGFANLILERGVEVAYGGIGRSGHAMTRHEVPLRRLEDCGTRLKRVEETIE